MACCYDEKIYLTINEHLCVIDCKDLSNLTHRISDFTLPPNTSLEYECQTFCLNGHLFGIEYRSNVVIDLDMEKKEMMKILTLPLDSIMNFDDYSTENKLVLFSRYQDCMCIVQVDADGN